MGKVPEVFSRRISPTKSSAKQGRGEFLTAAVEQGPSQARAPGAKKAPHAPTPHLPSLLVPSSGMEADRFSTARDFFTCPGAAHCVSTEDQQALSPPRFPEHRTSLGCSSLHLSYCPSGTNIPWFALQ